jgi:uncharacterized protein
VPDSIALISLISLGFFGGFSHCIGMCGPFVLHQSYENIKKFDLEQNYQISKIKSSLLIKYHLGRITTYSFIAAIFSQFTKIIDNNIFKNFSSLLMALAIIMILKSNYPKYFFIFKVLKIRAPKKITKYISQKVKNLNGFFLGIYLGFLPCGLVYAALMIASSSQNIITAFGLMCAFGISTIPALFCVSYGNSLLMKKGKKYLDFLIFITIAANVLSLLFYISKNLT